MRQWVDKRTNFPCEFQIAFYPARYAKEKFSILPVGDPTQYIPDSEVSSAAAAAAAECVFHTAPAAQLGVSSSVPVCQQLPLA